MRRVKVSDVLNWRIEEQKEENKTASLIGYRKYLDEALNLADYGRNYIKIYYDVLQHFKTLVEPQIRKTSTDEYMLKYNTANSWYHRDKNRVIQNFYEFMLKKICLSDSVDYKESLKRVHSMSIDEIMTRQIIDS
jgi:hypothetical protein